MVPRVSESYCMWWFFIYGALQACAVCERACMSDESLLCSPSEHVSNTALHSCHQLPPDGSFSPPPPPPAHIQTRCWADDWLRQRAVTAASVFWHGCFVLPRAQGPYDCANLSSDARFVSVLHFRPSSSHSRRHCPPYSHERELSSKPSDLAQEWLGRPALILAGQGFTCADLNYHRNKLRNNTFMLIIQRRVSGAEGEIVNIFLNLLPA